MFSIFNKWNKIKKHINVRQNYPACRPREVWWCSIGKNIGSEQSFSDDSFTRPVLVLKVYSRETFFGLPLTTKKTDTTRDRVTVNHVPKLRGAVNLTQGRTLDVRRLTRFVTKLPREDFDVIKQAFKDRL